VKNETGKTASEWNSKLNGLHVH